LALKHIMILAGLGGLIMATSTLSTSACLFAIDVTAQSSPLVNTATPVNHQIEAENPQLIQPEELAKIVQSSKGPKPLILYVGFHVLYLQAHIPRSEYIGPSSEPDGLERLRKRVQDLPHTRFIVLYCGCCPWSKCPNVTPAYKQLRAMGFTKVKLLYIPDNFGKDWVDKGFPVARGQ